MTNAQDLPDPIRRRLQFGLTSAEIQFDDLKQAGFARLREYQELVTRASTGAEVDADALYGAGAAVGRGPFRVLRDLDALRQAYNAWLLTFDPC